MHEPIKIKIGKDDEIAVILEKIIDADCQQVTLIIPRFSHIGESSANFHLLKRESGVLNKNIIIESIDAKVLELAEKNDLEAVNPFFGKEEKKSEENVKEEEAEGVKENSVEEKIEVAPKKTRGRKKKITNVEIKAIESQPVEEKRVLIEEEDEQEVPKAKSYSELVNEIGQKKDYKKIFKSGSKAILMAVSVILIIGIFYLIGFSILPRAEIKILTKKTEWSYNDSITVEKVVKSDSGAMTIAGQVFSEKKNYELKAPATGKKDVANKSTGMITIYNGYSSGKLSFGVNTKFTSPDGKNFILTKAASVPGAKIVDGKVVPSTIKVQVTAEKAGEDYNIEPAKFTIPSFKGTAKYSSVYGKSEETMKGGFIGELAYPTAEDIQKAKVQINQILEKGLREVIFAKIPNYFKVLEGATNFIILKQTVKEETDKDNNFSIFSEAQLKVIVFEEEELNRLLLSKAIEEKGQDLEVKTMDLKYELARGDFANDKLSFPVEFKVILRKKIDSDVLKQKIAGQPDLELRKIIFALPGMENASISFWPFWVNWVPKNTDRVKVTVD